jgi:hypothetical protein
VSRNQAVSLKASELLTLMEKKILSELFDGEGDEELFKSILSAAPKVQESIEEIFRLMNNSNSENVLMVVPTKRLSNSSVSKKLMNLDFNSSSTNNNIVNSTLINENKKIKAAINKLTKQSSGGSMLSSKLKNTILPNVILKVNTNIVNNMNTNSNNSEISRKSSLFPFDSKQTSLLFKGYLFNEELQDCTESLQKGTYCHEFYENTYNKYNNLEQRLAWKRKKVCKKLLHILKILVSYYITL